jgi:hypothetical protein
MLYYAENHPPIVTDALWEKAQRALGVRQPNRNRSRRRRHLLDEFSL